MSEAEEKRPYHHGNLRAELIGAGLRIVREDGPGALSTRACARRAGVSPAAVFRHFDSLRALATAIAVRGYEMLERRVAEARAGAGAPMDRFRAIGVAYLDFALEEPQLFRLMFRGEHLDMDDADLRRAGRPLTEAGEEDLRLLDPAADRRGLMAWALVHGLATLALDSQLDADLPADPRARRDSLLSVVSLLGPALRGNRGDALNTPESGG